MIINFAVSNWRSFVENTELSALASKERQHGERIPKSKRLQRRILPVVAIYGGNASGKTNFFQSLSFMRDLIVEGRDIDELINVIPYRFDTSAQEFPTHFKIDVLLNDQVWEYQFACDRMRIVHESLTVHTRSASHLKFERDAEQIWVRKGAKVFDPINFVAEGTRDNKLFLTNAIEQNQDEFKPLYDWFKQRLVFITPKTRLKRLDVVADPGGPLFKRMNAALRHLDTGVEKIGCKSVDFDLLNLPDSLANGIKKQAKQGNALMMQHPETGDLIQFSSQYGQIKAQRLYTYHQGTDGTLVPFDYRHESDGTKRVIDLLPAFLTLHDVSATYVIDELDRSLHTLLTRSLLESYLDRCGPDTRGQLFFTTHDIQLMDQALFRRDEMWVVERDDLGRSTLIPLSDFNADNRYDKDLRKSYLEGRMGGVPQLIPWGKTRSE